MKPTILVRHPFVLRFLFYLLIITSLIGCSDNDVIRDMRGDGGDEEENGNDAESNDDGAADSDSDSDTDEEEENSNDDDTVLSSNDDDADNDDKSPAGDSEENDIETDEENTENDDTDEADTGRRPPDRDDTGQEDTEQEDTGQEDTEQEDTEQEDTGREDTGREDTGQEDTGQEDTGQEDTEQEDTGVDLSGDHETMFVNGNKIYDANGNEFIPRGINLQYGDWPPTHFPAIPAIAGVHANIIRLQLKPTTTAEEFKNAVESIIQNQMIVMPMMWADHITCGTQESALWDAVNEWTGKHLSILTDPNYEKYMLLNIANEWGDYQTPISTWTNLYTQAVPTLRDAGIRVPLVIDPIDCGHDVDAFGEGGQQVFDSDPLGKIIFSVHAYCEWGSSTYQSNFDILNGYGFAWLFGEMGDTEHIVCNTGADHFGIMARAEEQGTGWIAWSWKGNGGSDVVLDMSNAYESANLTRRGNDIVSGANGLMDTSHRASYWPDF